MDNWKIEAYKMKKSMNNRNIFRLKSFPTNYFDFILDLGAYLGSFSLLARELHPNAKIVAIEGSEDPHFKQLVSITAGHNINCECAIIGNGKFLYMNQDRKDDLFERPDLDLLQFVSFNETGSGYMRQSVSLESIFDKYYEGGKVFIKCNIEGAERFFVGNDKVTSIIRKCHGITVQLHFKSEYCPDHPVELFYYHQFKKWYMQFSDIFTIDYHTSNRRAGQGYLTLIRKQL